MACKLCCERPEPSYYGSPRRCAFDEKGVFTSDNWNCETMNELRCRIRELNRGFNDDMECGSIGYVPYADLSDSDEDGLGGYIVMLWYKERGRTINAFVAMEGEGPRELTEHKALDALEYSKRFVGDV